jgi:hypothetical protein
VGSEAANQGAHSRRQLGRSSQNSRVPTTSLALSSSDSKPGCSTRSQLCRVHAKDQTTQITEAIIDHVIDVLAVTLSLKGSAMWRRQCGKVSSRR